ncbi:MAG: hypothetical protein QM737_23630 [Ferruginibacter sp.]
MKKLISILFTCTLFIAACKKHDSTQQSPIDPGENDITGTATITGIILDENNHPVANASISTNNNTTTSNENGLFLLKDATVSLKRCVLTISGAGYISSTSMLTPSAQSVNYVKVFLSGDAATHTVAATAGGSISLPDGSAVEFPSDAFITTSGSAYSGTVNISFKHFSPDDANFSFKIPGNDLLGKNTAGEKKSLMSTGMLGVILKGSGGENLQLANGKQATLTIPIPASQSATAASTIQLFYFDETISLWMQEGSAQRVGNNYVGKVSHFTWWNCGFAIDAGTVKGKVVDCNGAAIPNAVVSFNGGFSLITNQNGEYQSWYPSAWGTSIVQVSAVNNNGILNSQVENIPSLNYGQVFTVPDLVVACPSYISGDIKSCQGAAVDGLVNITWGANANGAYNFQYTSNGHFNMLAPENTAVDFAAVSYFNSDFSIFNYQYTTLASGSTLNVGDILLCDNIPGANWVRITGCALMNDTLINFYPPFTDFNAQAGNGNISAMYKSGTGITGTSFLLQGATVPGTYSLDDWSTNVVYWTKQDPANANAWLTFESYTGSITVDFGNVGDSMIATFSGTGVIRKPGINEPANIEGKMSVVRQH